MSDPTHDPERRTARTCCQRTVRDALDSFTKTADRMLEQQQDRSDAHIHLLEQQLQRLLEALLPDVAQNFHTLEAMQGHKPGFYTGYNWPHLADRMLTQIAKLRHAQGTELVP